MSHAHLLNRKAAAYHISRVFTLSAYNIQLRNIGKQAYSLPYKSNSNVLFFQQEHSLTFNPGTIGIEKMVSKIIGGINF